MPVSYTHLDVYKRQCQYTAPICGRLRSDLFYQLYYCRICTECMDRTSDRNHHDACICDIHEIFTEKADSCFFTEERSRIEKMRNGFRSCSLFYLREQRVKVRACTRPWRLPR